MDGLTLEAIVPSHTKGENGSYIPAEYAGSASGNAMSYLPVGNDGRPAWKIPEAVLPRILLP